MVCLTWSLCRKMWCIAADATPYVTRCGASLLCPPADATPNVTSARQGLYPLGRTWSLRPRVIERTLGTRPRDAEPWARVNSARTRPCVLSARDREMWDLRLVSPLHISRSRRLSRSCIVRDTRPRQGPGRDDTTEMWGLGLARVSVLYRLGSDRASPRLHLESFAPVIASSVY